MGQLSIGAGGWDYFSVPSGDRVRMYRDAARLKSFLNSGQFHSLTGQFGLESQSEVLIEDARFPTSKSRLVAEQGWKLFDMTAEERVRARIFLERLPEKTYSTIDEVLASLGEMSV